MTNTAHTAQHERRSVPRASSLSCPHCLQTRIQAHHARDTGDMNPADAVAAGYCPTLVAKRNRLDVPAVRSTELVKVSA